MRTKVTLVLVFLNVALFFFIFQFERHWRTERASLETRRRVLGPEASDIRSLEVTSAAPGATFRLARRGDNWWLTAPLEWPANPAAVDSIIHELQLLEHVSSFEVAQLAQNNQGLADYGLDKPKLTIAFATGENSPTTTTLRVGDVTKDGSRVYLLSSDLKRIHVVGHELLDRVALTSDQLRANTLLTIPVFEARALSVQTGGVRVRIRRENAPSDPGAQSDRWLFDTIVDARANKTALEVAIIALNALHPRAFYPPNTVATLPSAAPTLRITLEGNNRSETLFLGDALGTTAIPTGVATEPDVEFYAQIDRRPALFTVAVPAELLKVLKNAPVALRERHILDFNAAAVTAITLASPVRQATTPPLTLQRLDPTANGDDGGHWQIVRRSDAALGPQTIPADAAAVQKLLGHLTELVAKNFATNASTNADLENWGFKRPERNVTLTLAGATTPLVLQLGTGARRDDVFALVGAADAGSSIYAVDAKIIDDLPLSPRDWRSRQLPKLPDVARITALKLTDLASNQVLLDTVFDADGRPSAAGASPAALATIVAQLREPRAKKFVQDMFTDKATTAGEERPWKFKLDYTVSLPGGAGAEQTSTKTLFLMDRAGGAEQLAGSQELDAVFEIEQPFLDALNVIISGPRDPGPPAPTPATPPAEAKK